MYVTFSLYGRLNGDGYKLFKHDSYKPFSINTMALVKESFVVSLTSMVRPDMHFSTICPEKRSLHLYSAAYLIQAIDIKIKTWFMQLYANLQK